MGLERGVSFHVLEKLSEFFIFVVPNKAVLLGNVNILGNYKIFKSLQEETDLKKVFKIFLAPFNAGCCKEYFRLHLVGII